MNDIKTLLKQFDCNEDEISIFGTLLNSGEQTVASIAKNTSTKRTTVYGIITRLLQKNLIEEIHKNSVKTYRTIDKEKLKKNLDNKIDNLKNIKDNVDILMTSLSGTKTMKPELKFFEGKEGVQFVLNDLIIRKNIETETFWPIEKMLKILGKDYFKFLNRERIKRNIYTRAIWPEKQIIDTKTHPYMGSGEEFLREIRIAPKQIDFSMGYWIYENNVAFISSEKEVYAFIIKSEEFADMLRKQWELVWSLSKPLKQKANPEIQKFLMEI
jgi:HTH-type transcriptional regulator, sugar sensing transcriptional regulator